MSDFLFSVLIEKLGDNLQKVRTAAEDTILAMCDHDGFGTKMTMNALTRSIAPKNSSKTAKKTMNSNK
jgi:hypothetical protein